MIFLILCPLLAAPLCRLLADRRRKAALLLWELTVGGVLAGSLGCFLKLQTPVTFEVPGICSLGLRLKIDGFRSLYLCVASFMWFCTALFSPRYFRHDPRWSHYLFFNLLTYGATLGVFLSDDLYTTLIFFEIMSFTSYTWVVQEETPGAMRAGQTYLAVAVIGGLATLMGLFLLWHELGTLTFEGMRAALQDRAAPDARITAGAWLTLFGFAAKAGLFPIHIWLPKAHPVAPAPASALLSGILTKSGVFGMIVVSTRIMAGQRAFADALLILGAATMVLGALLALFSVDLKRTLASSSVSQIGFITVGLAISVLLGQHGALAAYGTLLHMVNHSLFKLCLFLCAGVVFMNLEELDLNRVRGFGRKKPLLAAVFLIGAVGIGCIPPLGSGFNSKSLIHEGILEWIEELQEQGLSWAPYKALEILFLFSGGLTIAYMIKLCVCLFVERNNDAAKQRSMDQQRHYLGSGCAAALLLAALPLLPMGFLPNQLLSPLAARSMPFFGRTALSQEMHYFSWENLKGALESMTIGLAIYFFAVRKLLMRRDAKGRTFYVNRWPAWLDLEDQVYRPFLAFLVRAASWITRPIASLPESRGVTRFFPLLITGITRLLAEGPEHLALFLRRTIFALRRPARPAPVGTRLTYNAGRIMNVIARTLNRTILRNRPMRTDFEYVFDASQEEAVRETGRILHTVSFGLLLLAMGLVGVCLILIFRG